MKSSSTTSTSAVSTKTPEFIRRRLAILVDVKNANADQINPTAFSIATIHLRGLHVKHTFLEVGKRKGMGVAAAKSNNNNKT